MKCFEKNKKLKVKLLGRGFAWFDAGLYDSFLEASNFIATIDKNYDWMSEEVACKFVCLEAGKEVEKV